MIFLDNFCFFFNLEKVEEGNQHYDPPKKIFKEKLNPCWAKMIFKTLNPKERNLNRFENWNQEKEIVEIFWGGITPKK